MAVLLLRVCLWVSLGLATLGGSRKDTDYRFSPVQGPATVTKVVFHKSVSDTNLMYEILLRGLVIEKDNNIVLQDEELASMRQGRVFVSLINDNVPKSRVTMQRLLGRLQAERWPLEMFHFETLVLGAVYSAHQARRQKSAEEQAVWGGLLMQLVNTTLLDLRKTPQLGSNALGTY